MVVSIGFAAIALIFWTVVAICCIGKRESNDGRNFAFGIALVATFISGYSYIISTQLGG